MKRESFEMQNLSSNYVCPAVIVGIDRCAKQICSRTVIKAGVNEDDLTLYRSPSLSIGFRSFSFSIVSKRRDKNLIKSAAGRECFRRLAARIVRREYYFFFFFSIQFRTEIEEIVNLRIEKDPRRVYRFQPLKTTNFVSKKRRREKKKEKYGDRFESSIG